VPSGEIAVKRYNPISKLPPNPVVTSIVKFVHLASSAFCKYLLPLKV